MQEWQLGLLIFGGLLVSGVVYYQWFQKRVERIPLSRLNSRAVRAYEDDMVSSKRKVETHDEEQDWQEDSYQEEAFDEAPNVSQLYILYVMADKDRVFQGYELLQALLASDLRHGEMGIFHRYSLDSTQNGIAFSLASAQEPGTFDMQNMASFLCKGLSLFTQDANPETRQEMLDTAYQLAYELGGTVCDAGRQPLTQV